MKKLTRKPERFKGRSLGLDLHKESIHYSLLEEGGEEVASERIAATASELTRLIERLVAQGVPLQAVVEASGCFVWAFDLLVEHLGRERVHVAAPARVRVIAESSQKTDATDAWWLAWLLHEGTLPEAFVAEGDLRELRVATRELRSVTDERADLKRRMKSHLAQLGLGFKASEWESVKGRGRIAELVEDCRSRHGTRGEAIARLWARIEAMEEEVDHWRGRVAALSEKFEEVALIDAQLPGMGPTLAPVAWGELGDPRRYRSAKAYAKATGLTPGYRESGGRRSRGRKITREGSAHVRWALTRAVKSCVRCKREGPGLAVRRWVEARSRRKPRKAAMVAAARKLAEGLWRLFALGEAFDVARAFGGPRACKP